MGGQGLRQGRFYRESTRDAGYESAGMKCRRLLLVFCFALAQIGWAGDGMKVSETKMKAAIQSVITQQLAAFRAGDFKAAYVFADQGLKEVYPVEAFEKMVRTAYPVIAGNISGRCGLTFDNGDEAVVNLRVFGPGEEAVDYQYTLRRDGEMWRITGVVLLKDQTIEV